MSFTFTFDPNRCTGCGACVVGCWMENGDQQTQSWRQIHTFNPSGLPGLPRFQLSLACHHCEDPACLRHCPVEAYTRDAVTGAVTLHPDRCMGCRYCTWACPHDAPKFNPTAGTIEKCTFCPSRLEAGLEPACVARCPVEALGFERKETTRPASVAPPGFPASELRPSLHFTALRNSVPDKVEGGPWKAWMAALLEVPEPKITLRGEWGLLLFTTTLAGLAAWFVGALVGGPAVRTLPFLGAGALVMGLSVLHLGRPERAWRAVLHVRTSWLSREILLSGLFLGGAGLNLVFLPQFRALAWAAGIAGFLSLMAVDRLYRVALKVRPWNLHSGGALLTAHYLLGFFANLPLLIFGAGAVKMGLYLFRKIHFHRQGRGARPGLSALRVTLGFLSPLLLMGWNPALAAVAALLGDLVDRAEFYDELEVRTPQGELIADLKQRLN